VVLFGLLPGLILDLIKDPVAALLEDVANAAPIAIDPLVVATALGLIAAAVVARVGTLPGLRRPAAATGEGAA